MSGALPPSIAIILPPNEGFGPRRTRGIGLMVREHAISCAAFRPVVFGGDQDGPVFLDVTFRLVNRPFWLPGTQGLRYIAGLIGPLRALRAALIEVHAEPAVALRLQSLFPSVPVVLVLHDDPLANRATRAPARRARLLDRLARVQVPSAWMRDRLLDELPAPVRPPVVVPPSVDLESLPVPAAKLDAAGVPVARRRVPLILFVGRLIPDKGADLFTAACAIALPHMPGWRAEVVGAPEHRPRAPETSFVRMLQALARPAGIALMGYRDHPDVMAAMARAAIVVLPSREADPGGRVVLEAMANGAAVICARRGAFPEIGGDAVMYVDGDHPADIAAAIRAAASDPQRMAAMSDAGRERAQQYDQPRIGRLADTIWAEIVAEGRRRS